MTETKNFPKPRLFFSEAKFSETETLQKIAKVSRLLCIDGQDIRNAPPPSESAKIVCLVQKRSKFRFDTFIVFAVPLVNVEVHISSS